MRTSGVSFSLQVAKCGKEPRAHADQHRIRPFLLRRQFLVGQVLLLFLISSAFTLAKTLRDACEADLLDARLAGRRDAVQAE